MHELSYKKIIKFSTFSFDAIQQQQRRDVQFLNVEYYINNNISFFNNKIIHYATTQHAWARSTPLPSPPPPPPPPLPPFVPKSWTSFFMLIHFSGFFVRGQNTAVAALFRTVISAQNFWKFVSGSDNSEDGTPNLRRIDWAKREIKD